MAPRKKTPSVSSSAMSHLPRTVTGRLNPTSVINAWTRTKIAQGIREKSKTNTNRNNNGNNVREMAVNMRRRFIHLAPRTAGLVLYRGLSINDPSKLRNETGPSSWTNRRKTARVFALKNTQNGIVLRTTLKANTPYIKISPNPRLRYSHLGEHVLPPGRMQVLSYNANNRVWNVNFIPNKRYLKNWTFY
jgi:hypothetical protein